MANSHRRVFISSAIRDYEEFRQVARRAVDELNQTSVTAEDFTAQPRSPRSACLEGVRQSDIYLGIFGERYSRATADEYDEAVRLGKDVLIFVEKVEKEASQAEFVQRTEDYASGRFRSSFVTAEELQREILRSLGHLITAPRPDYDSGDAFIRRAQQRLQKPPQMGNESWVWVVLAPASSEQLLSASEFHQEEFATNGIGVGPR